MYLPDHFKETDPAAIAALVKANPLATIVAQGNDGLFANHIPLIMVADTQLIGHIARANDMHRILADGQEILAVFQGTHGYISPNWYPTKAETHQQVPTWNYEVVHLHGRIRFQHDEKSKRAVVGRLTKHFETAQNGAQAWKMSDAPQDYMTARLAEIVAFEIDVTRVLAKAKLSQNKSPIDAQGAAKMLAENGQGALSERMIKKLAPNTD